MGNSESQFNDAFNDACPSFTSEEISRLAKRFNKLDEDGSGSLSWDEFMKLIIDFLHHRERVLPRSDSR